MEDSERISQLEKKVKRIEIVEFIRFSLIVLGFIGLTTIFMNKLKKLK